MGHLARIDTSEVFINL